MSNYYVTGYTAPPSSPYAPGATNCSQVNSQNTITIRVSQVHLASALAGTYSQTFSVDMCRLQGGSPVECAAQVNFVVNLPELIQLTQLENFDFNTWAGIGSLQSSRDFCVFRNGHGGFSLNAVGSNDAAGRYAVSDGTNRIPYELEFREGGPWYTATPGNQLTSAATGFNGDGTRDCDGGTSHSIRVTMDENDLSAAQPGAYTDTLTILVQPD